jgi:hypothetical protein
LKLFLTTNKRLCSVFLKKTANISIFIIKKDIISKDGDVANWCITTLTVRNGSDTIELDRYKNINSNCN